MKENENMKLTTVLFDLDGTLLPMDNDEFTKGEKTSINTGVAALINFWTISA